MGGEKSSCRRCRSFLSLFICFLRRSFFTDCASLRRWRYRRRRKLRLFELIYTTWVTDVRIGRSHLYVCECARCSLCALLRISSCLGSPRFSSRARLCLLLLCSLFENKTLRNVFSKNPH